MVACKYPTYLEGHGAVVGVDDVAGLVVDGGDPPGKLPVWGLCEGEC